jgi:hypothetical protein
MQGHRPHLGCAIRPRGASRCLTPPVHVPIRGAEAPDPVPLAKLAVISCSTIAGVGQFDGKTRANVPSWGSPQQRMALQSDVPTWGAAVAQRRSMRHLFTVNTVDQFGWKIVRSNFALCLQLVSGHRSRGLSFESRCGGTTRASLSAPFLDRKQQHECFVVPV